MTTTEIRRLQALFMLLDSEEYRTLDKVTKGTRVANFHDWANSKKYNGAFLIQNKSEEAYWFMLVEWKPIKKNNYLVIFPKDRGTPLIEIHSLGNGHMNWNYAPSKRDGLNKRRKAYFEKYYYDTRVKIAFPEKAHEFETFIDELFTLAEVRKKADVLDNRVPEFRDSFAEGKRKQHMHELIERDRKLVRVAKAQFKSKHGRLFCEICGFDFARIYGKIGEDFIEAHHTSPLSLIDNPEHKSKVEDLAMVCSNCHKMLHRRRPWLAHEELKKLLTKYGT